jgi:hypothetical protein
MEPFTGLKELSKFLDLFAANGINGAVTYVGVTSVEQYLLYLPLSDASGRHSGAGVVGKDNF